MPLIMNGVEIPEDGGEVIMNGVSLDIVIMNGVEVWKKYVYAGVWSGSSIPTGPARASDIFIDTSGIQYRMSDGVTTFNWLSTNLDGTFENGSSGTLVINNNVIMSGGAGQIGFETSPNGITFGTFNSSGVDEILFTLASGFTGSAGSNNGNSNFWETSGGQMRCSTSVNTIVYSGDWITLS